MNHPVEPDPREFRYVRVADLEVDPGEQRDISLARQARIERIAAAWDWFKCEALTVRCTAMGHLKVVEGQGRAMALRLRDPDAMIPCLILPVDRVEAAGVASGIARSRTGHSRYDHWKLAVRQGGEYELAAEEVMEARFLRVGQTSSANVIGAVAVVKKIIHAQGSSPHMGAAILGQVLDILIEAYPGHNVRNNSLRWHAVMLGIVYKILVEVPLVEEDAIFDPSRLSRVLSARPVDQWINLNKDSLGGVNGDALLTTLINDYNKHLRYARLARV